VTFVPVELPITEPFLAEALLVFFGRHAVPGIETYHDGTDDLGRRIDYARTLRLPSGPATIGLSWSSGRTSAWLEVADPRDLTEGRRRIEQLCDLRRDIAAVESHLSEDEELRPLLATSPGLRVPGAVDVHEHLFRTMIGQQISLAGAANCAGKLVARFGEPCPTLDEPSDPARPDRLFPTAAALAEADPETLPMPRARGRAVVQVAEALASGTLLLDHGSDPGEARAALLRCRGVGPWTADYVLMRALQAPDILLATDLVIKRELARRRITDTTHWSPWRSYATMHLWRSWTG
jgi:AraC family transcriptional regulator of adaptative response / DNA-3-methyladenine glycosylase II